MCSFYISLSFISVRLVTDILLVGVQTTCLRWQQTILGNCDGYKDTHFTLIIINLQRKPGQNGTLAIEFSVG